ncbi:MAG: GTPase HflX [Bdellovibrionota bacterium]
MSNKIEGQLSSIKKADLKNIEKLLRKKIPNTKIITWELAKYLVKLCSQVQQSIGISIARNGVVENITIGGYKEILPTSKTRLRNVASRLSGYRFVYCSFATTFDQRILNDLETKRHDLLCKISMDERGIPSEVELAHLVPDPSGRDTIATQKFGSVLDMDIDFEEFISQLESDFQNIYMPQFLIEDQVKAILCYHALGKSVTPEDIHETIELSRTAGLKIVDIFSQKKGPMSPRTLFGSGKVQELYDRAIYKGADLILFHNNLTASQFRILGDLIELPLIDRTQLILDIFAQHAKTHEGKLQVELAQLKYTYPRLREKNTQMSRLVGGIGGRGPGETKLEIHRRRANEKITRLTRSIEQIRETRQSQRKMRQRNHVPQVSIVGYTNAGKSTLLNAMTQADALSEDKLFATLDPLSKKLRFPQDQEIIFTDTVGFIRDLPKELIEAFKATLEEIEMADLILHVIDGSNPNYESHIEVVDELLTQLHLSEIPQIKVFNKCDKIDAQSAENIAHQYGGYAISAMERKSFLPLLDHIQHFLLQPVTYQIKNTSPESDV